VTNVVLPPDFLAEDQIGNWVFRPLSPKRVFLGHL